MCTQDAVYFYSDREPPYGGFSNFSRHGFTLEGRYWSTSDNKKEKLTSQMRVILKRLAMPNGQIEETRDTYLGKSAYGLSWREDGTLYGCNVTERMVQRLDAMGLITAEHHPRYSKGGKFVCEEALYVLARQEGKQQP